MKMKLTALVLTLCMLFTCLTGCGNAKTAETSPEPTASAEPEESPAATDSASEDDALQAAYEKYAPAYEKYAPDTVVLTINGEDVLWSDYFYWLCSAARQLQSYYPDLNWTDDLDGTYTYQSYCQYYAEQSINQYWLISQKAAELGVELTDEAKQSVEELYNSDVAEYAGGDEKAFEEYISKMFITSSMYNRLSETSQYYELLFRHYFGEEGASLSDEDTLAYVADAGYLHAKHILFSIVDSEGAALDETALAEKRALAEDVLAQLKACTTADELTAKFDELMNEYTEDSGAATNPNGYYFMPGEMIPVFEETASTLEDNTVSEIVESNYGYHIILRLPIGPDDVLSSGMTMRFTAAAALYDNITTDWFTTSEIVYKDGFSDMSFDELFAE